MSTLTSTDRLAMMDEANTYWHKVEKIPNDPNRYYGPDFQPVPYALLWDSERMKHDELDVPTRTDLVAQYSWAIPSPDTLRWILETVGDRGIVEMGAGTGYWASLLTLGGADVVAYDIAPPDQAENWYHSIHETYKHTLTQDDVDEHLKHWGPMYQMNDDLAELTKDSDHPFPVIPKPDPPKVGDIVDRQQVVPGARRPIFFPVQQGSVEKLAEHPDRVLLLCWPPYDNPFAADALRAFQGDTLIYIGEGTGGCCADDDFFDLLDEWEEVDYFREHVQWSGLRDGAGVYRRRKGK